MSLPFFPLSLPLISFSLPPSLPSSLPPFLLPFLPPSSLLLPYLLLSLPLLYLPPSSLLLPFLLPSLPPSLPLDEWTMEDKVTFEQAFQYHGKNFQRIRAMLPDKPISSLVKYYYLWKKSYSQYSLMDRHARKNSRRIRLVFPPIKLQPAGLTCRWLKSKSTIEPRLG